MKAKQMIILVAFILSVLFGSVYVKFFSTIGSSIHIYVCQVGIYKEEANANAMIEKLKGAGLQGYSYKKDSSLIVISGIFLKEDEANALGKKISEQQLTCVIKQYSIAKDLKEAVEKKEYENVVKELAS